MNNNTRRFARVTEFLALNRTVAVVLATVLFFGLGEHLWESFMPAYLEARANQTAQGLSAGAGTVSWQALAIIGIYGFCRNLFEGFCYIGGGQLTARLGDRGSLILFGLLTIAGYTLFLSFSSPLMATLAALFILGWEPLSVPVTFTTIGSTVKESKQGMAFAVQSIQKRLPKVIGPPIAGLVIWLAQRRSETLEVGRIAGMQYLVAIALGLGLVSLFIQFRWMPKRESANQAASAIEIVSRFHPTLRRLLLAEIFTRWCDWLVRELIVIYVIVVRGAADWQFGLLLLLTNATALLTYLPIGGMTQSVGLQPFIGLTFVFFALFPLVLAWVPSGPWLAVAFVVYGLREIGEPARKALITSLMPEPLRARGVGLYWGLRSFAICSSSLAGSAIWFAFGPEVLLHVAFALGCVGAAVFYGFARTRPPNTNPNVAACPT